MDVAEWCGSSNIMKKKKSSSSKNKKRFSDEQIRSLEVMFECETKLEPKKKVQLARELGLQPRQVAIWFQNKRARWKSKHIEKEYTKLLASYNNLASQYDILKKEKQSLLSQLQKMKSGAEGTYGSDEEDSCIKAELLGLDEESEFLRMVEPIDSSSDDHQIWGTLDSPDMIDQTADGTFQWWDFCS